MENKYLIIHACDAKNYNFLLSNDSIVYPSLAIINHKEHIPNEFGDVIFIGSDKFLPEYMGDKSHVFSKDAYTIRPEKMYLQTNKQELFNEVVKIINKIFKEDGIINQLDSEINTKYKLEYDDYLNKLFQKNISEQIRIDIPNILVKYINDSFAIYAQYKLNSNIPIENIVENLSANNNYLKDISEKIKKENNDEFDILKKYFNEKINNHLFDNKISTYVGLNGQHISNNQRLKNTNNSLMKKFNNKLKMSEFEINLSLNKENISITQLKAFCCDEYLTIDEIESNLHKIKNIEFVKNKDNEIISNLIKKLDEDFNLVSTALENGIDIHNLYLLTRNLIIETFIDEYNIVDSLYTLGLIQNKSKFDDNDLFAMDRISEIVKDVIHQIKNMETTYFELKIQDDIAYSQFEAVLIPQNMSRKLEFKTKMEDLGIDVIEYDSVSKNDNKFNLFNTLEAIADEYKILNTIDKKVQENDNKIKTKLAIGF